MHKLTFPESKKYYDEIDDFAYDVIYKKELGPKTPKKLMSKWRDGYNILTVRLEETDLLIAMGMLQKPKRNLDTLQIEHVCVDPEFQHHKLGSLVVSTLIENAKECGASKVRLRSLQESVEFYKHCGFTEYDKTLHLMHRKIQL